MKLRLLCRGILNKVNPPFIQSFAFSSDILGNGKEQFFTILKNNFTSKNINEYNLVVSQDNQVINTFKITGHGSWYVAYLRNNATPDLIYLFYG